MTEKKRPFPPACLKPVYVRKVHCPVQILTRQAINSARTLTRSLRGLQRSARLCNSCPQRPCCPDLSDLNAQLDLALQEIADEWGLSHM